MCRCFAYTFQRYPSPVTTIEPALTKAQYMRFEAPIWTVCAFQYNYLYFTI